MVHRVSLGAKLRSLRLASGLTQVKFAQGVGGGTGHLSRCETGERLPTIEWLERFSGFTGVTIHSLLQGATGNGCAIWDGDWFLTEIALIVTNLSGYNRKIIIEVLQGLNYKGKIPRGKSK